LKKLLLISHSSNIGGGEEDFLKLLMYLYGKFEILTVFPKGKNAELFKKYSNKHLEIEGYVFPFTEFKLKEYLKFFLKNFKDVLNINKFIKDNKLIDLCIVNSSVCFLNVIPVILNKIQYVLSVKELINPLFIRKLIYLIFRKTVLKIVTISKYLQNEITKISGRNDIDIIYSTLDIKYFNQVINEISIISSVNRGNQFKIVNIGHIYKLKGQHLLVEALSKIGQYNITIEFIGRVIDEKYYSKINRIIEKNKLSEKINFTGELQKKEVIEKIISSDCIIVTSKQEGQSFAILESLYLGKPLITTKVGVAPEVIKDGINGLLFDFGNTESLSFAIKRLIEDKNCYNRLKSNCKITYEKYFGSEDTLGKWSEIIKMYTE
jgi:glycosyltransferase involved in cell wall biosynthesis